MCIPVPHFRCAWSHDTYDARYLIHIFIFPQIMLILSWHLSNKKNSFFTWRIYMYVYQTQQSTCMPIIFMPLISVSICPIMSSVLVHIVSYCVYMIHELYLFLWRNFFVYTSIQHCYCKKSNILHLHTLTSYLIERLYWL